MSHKLTVLAALASLALGGPAVAQEHMMGQSDLPEVCKPGGSMPNSMMTDMSMPEGTDEAHAALNAGMAKMGADMAVGMTAEDIDVAFVCGMIPHHQGAIDMAKAELQYGDEPWAKEMAQKVIAAQEQEIKDIIAWLEERGQ
ncbi:MAG: CopM family metallochaperone [Devosia sp.]